MREHGRKSGSAVGPGLYSAAASVLAGLERREGALKTLVYGSRFQASRNKYLHVFACICINWSGKLGERRGLYKTGSGRFMAESEAAADCDGTNGIATCVGCLSWDVNSEWMTSEKGASPSGPASDWPLMRQGNGPTLLWSNRCIL